MLIPKFIKRLVQAAGLEPHALRAARLFARLWCFGFARYCPICKSRLRYFRPYKIRLNAQCPVCRSLERHRHLWLLFRSRTDLLDGVPKKMLHVAPEPALARLFSKIRNLDYLSGDLDSRWAMMKLDVTNLQLPDDTFDVIYCSHVLEHVPEDRQAMAELFRVMRPGGWGVLQVPVLRETTYEDPGIQSPEERLRAFGQWDHVRVYGKDYRDRLEEVGFSVTVDSIVREMSPSEREYMGLPETEDVYFCRKPRSHGKS